MIELKVKSGDLTYETLVDLNVRTGPSSRYPLQPRDQLTDDGRKHSTGSVLHKNTRVTVLEIIVRPQAKCVWIRIPSGYICGVDGDKKYVKEINV